MSTTQEKANIVRFTVHWVEGYQAGMEFPMNFNFNHGVFLVGPTAWGEIQAILRGIALLSIAPKPGNGYNKLKFTLEWEDGFEYTGRFDLQEGGVESGGMTLRDHIRNEFEYLGGIGHWATKPHWYSERNWNDYLAKIAMEPDAAERSRRLIRDYIED
jgi:hypothetical protein